jgi:hypothetical protein
MEAAVNFVQHAAYDHETTSPEPDVEKLSPVATLLVLGSAVAFSWSVIIVGIRAVF